MSKLDFEQVLPAVHDEVSNALQVSNIVGVLVPKAYDAIAVTYYTSGNGTGQVATITYYVGGQSGTAVATLTLVYNASGQIIQVTRT